MLVTSSNDKSINFLSLSGEVLKKNQSFKKTIDFFNVVPRPLSLFRSSLSSTQKAKRIQQTYASFKKVKNLSDVGSFELPIMSNPNANHLMNSRSCEVSQEFVDGLVKFVCKPRVAASSNISPFGPNTSVAAQQTSKESLQQQEEIKNMKERIQKLMNMNQKLVEQINNLQK